MDKIDKTLLRIPDRHRRKILTTSKQIRTGKLEGLNLKKLRGSKDLFRVRVGKYRVIIQVRSGNNPVIIDVSKRDDRTYKGYK